MQYHLLSSLRGYLLGSLLLLASCGWLEGHAQVVTSSDTTVQRDHYKVIIDSSERHRTDVTLIDYNEQNKMHRMETTAYEMPQDARIVISGFWTSIGVMDGNNHRWGTIRLLPKLYFGTTMMLGDAFPHAGTPCFNHFMVAPVGYRYYIKNLIFVGFDLALEGRSYGLRDGYYFTPNNELNELSQSRYNQLIGLRQSKLVTRYISLPISLGVLPIRSSRLRIGLEVIPQIKYQEYVMHRQYGNRHKEHTKTEATPPLSLTYGAFVDFRPVGVYLHYTPQSLLLIQDEKSGYNNKGLLTAGLSIIF